MSGPGSDESEKSHEPTPKKLEDARKKGDIPRSDEVTSAAVYLGLILASAMFGEKALRDGGAVLAQLLDKADTLTGVILGPGGGALWGAIQGELLRALGPLILLPMLAALVTLVAQRAIVVSADKITPKLSRLSPLAAVKNKFGPTGLMDFSKRFIKLGVVFGVVVAILWAERDVVIGSAIATPGAAVAQMFNMMMDLLVAVTVLAFSVAALDLAWVQFDHRRKLKMSFQEIRDEAKDAEGDPMLKARRRRRANDIASNRMMSDVPKADVIIVNPTHFAVALKWERTPGSAPVCVAKGQDAVAAMIREIAEKHGIPIQQDAPTARALFACVEIGQEVPPDHYRPVAAAISFAEALRKRARASGIAP